MTIHGLRRPPGKRMRSESAPKIGAASIEMNAPAPRASPSALPLVASPTAALIWLGIVMIKMADHIMLVENQKTLNRICRNVDMGGRTKFFCCVIPKSLSNESD